MRKHWPVGAVLGVSLVLLLAVGCADRDCIECSDGMPQGIMPPDEHVVNFSAEGISGETRYCANLYQNGEPVMQDPECGEPGVALATGSFFVTCEPPTFFLINDIPGARDLSGGVKDYLGQWQLRVWVEEINSQNFVEWLVEWLVADDCAQAEFVPEAGSIALLGSGLAGLAGYAAFRWKARG